MFQFKGRFLGTVNQTKKGGYIRQFLTSNDVVLTVYSQQKDVLEQAGDITLSCDIQDMVFAK